VAKNVQSADNADETLDALKMRAFTLRLAGMTWTEVGKECGVSMTQARRWSQSPEWSAESERFVEDVRKQIQSWTCSGTEKAIATLMRLMDSPDEDVRLKAAGQMLEWCTKARVNIQPREAAPTTDAEAAKLLAGATSLPTLPDGVEG